MRSLEGGQSAQARQKAKAKVIFSQPESLRGYSVGIRTTSVKNWGRTQDGAKHSPEYGLLPSSPQPLGTEAALESSTRIVTCLSTHIYPSMQDTPLCKGETLF